MKKQSAALIFSLFLTAILPSAPSFAINCTLVSTPVQVIVYDPNPAPDPAQEKVAAF